MRPIEAYKIYLGIRNHFNNKSYDYVKYNKKVNVNPETFEKRKDKLFFQKLAKHDDLENFLVANFIKTPKTWIKDLAYSEEAERNYKDWLKLRQSFTYNFQNEISKMEDYDFNELFLIKENQHPILLKYYLSGEISLETLCVLLNVTGALKHWNDKLEYDVIWDSISHLIIKYTPFIYYDKDKVKKICLETFK